MERVDPQVEAHRIRQAAEHERACIPGLSDDRLRVVRARLLADADGGDPITLARLDVVEQALHHRGVR